MKRLLILTTDKTSPKWRTIKNKLAFFDRILASGKNANFAPTETMYVDVVPKVINGRIDHDWLEKLKSPYFSKGYDIIGLHTSMKQWKDWGIEGSLRGANPNRLIELEDFYFSADEHTKREGLNRYEQVGGHELGHGYYDHSGEPDIVHAWHEVNSDISGLFKTFDWSKYQPARLGLRTFLNNAQKSFIEILRGKVAFLTPKDQMQPLVQRKAEAVLAEMKRLGHEVRIVQGYRSIAEQNRLYAQGRNGNPGAIVTNAQGGYSFHNYGVAVDFIFRREGYNASKSLWQLLGKVGKAQGFEWGGDWKGFVDRPHFELPLGYTVKDFRDGKVDYRKYI
jgi:hypothetical protein